MKNISLHMTVFILSIFSVVNGYSQNLWNINQKNSGNRPFVNIDGMNSKSFSSNGANKSLNLVATDFAKMSLKEDSSRAVSKFYDSVRTRSQNLNVINGADFVKLATVYSVKTNNLVSASQLAKNSVDSFALANAALSIDEKMRALNEYVNRIYHLHVRPDSLAKADSLNEIKNNWLNADDFVRNSPTKLKGFLEIFEQKDTTVTNQIKDLNSRNLDVRYSTYVVLALQADTVLKPYFVSLRALGASNLDSIGIRIQMDDIINMVSKLTQTEKPHISLFASGDFLSTIQSSSIGSNNSILSGTIGVNYTNKKNSAMLKIIFASTQDTIINNYGTQILVPAKGKGFGTAVAGINHIFKASPDNTRTWSYSVIASASTQHWRVDSAEYNNLDSINTKQDSTFNQSATILGLDLTVNRTIVIKDSIPVGSNKYALSFNFNFGMAARFLGGDVLKPLQNKNSILYPIGYYVNRLPTTRKVFIGFEAGASISIGPILAEFEVYEFPSTHKDQQSLYGLTGLQVAFGASINLNLWHN